MLCHSPIFYFRPWLWFLTRYKCKVLLYTVWDFLLAGSAKGGRRQSSVIHNDVHKRWQNSGGLSVLGLSKWLLHKTTVPIGVNMSSWVIQNSLPQLSLAFNYGPVVSIFESMCHMIGHGGWRGHSERGRRACERGVGWQIVGWCWDSRGGVVGQQTWWSVEDLW